MGLRINTNVPAEYASYNLQQTNNKLSLALERLSTGVRITKAANDAAGMTIANSLQFQSNNLGQAIMNGNNAINLIQISDQSLSSSVNLVSTIATKATEAANATQNSASRDAIQADVKKLLGEIDNIANTTSYRGVKLLDGSFTNKLVQVGAYQDQTLSMSIQRAATNSLGWVAVTPTTGPNNITTNFATPLQAASTGALGAAGIALNASTNKITVAGGDLTINGVNVGDRAFGINQNQQLDANTMAQAINTVTNDTGVTATATNVQTGTAPITAGTISAGTFYINGVNIGQIDVSEKDATGSVVNAINQYTDQTGVTASTNSKGELVLTGANGENIAVQANTNAQGLLNIENNTTALTGSTTTVTASLSFYLNGTSITVAKGASAYSAAQSINAQLSQAGVNTNTLHASYTATSGGDLKIIANGGEDLNVNANGLAASSLSFLGLGTSKYYLANDSYHGKIQLQSESNITVGGTNAAVAGLTDTHVGLNTNLSDINLSTQSGAELAITIANSALKNLDAIRSNIGSAQNQITASVENNSITQINISQAESSIMDVNFAKESSTFSKLQILAQAGTYALAQANTIQQNILKLL